MVCLVDVLLVGCILCLGLLYVRFLWLLLRVVLAFDVLVLLLCVLC